MRGTTTTTNLLTPRLLNAATLWRLANGFRLPKYSALAMQTEDEDVNIYTQSICLWRCLWPGVAIPHGDAWDVECELLERISHELFPLDHDAIDEMIYNSDEHPLWGPIWAQTYGLPWETCGVCYLSDAVAALAAAAWPGLPPEPFLAAAALNEREVAADWLAARGLRWPNEDYLLNWTAITADLAALPEPLDGLASAYKCLLRNTGNRFIDDVPVMWHAEYDHWDDGHPYSLPAILDYTNDWRAAQSEIARLNAYCEWYQNYPGAESRVLAVVRDIFLLEDIHDDDE